MSQSILVYASDKAYVELDFLTYDELERPHRINYVVSAEYVGDELVVTTHRAMERGKVIPRRVIRIPRQYVDRFGPA